MITEILYMKEIFYLKLIYLTYTYMPTELLYVCVFIVKLMNYREDKDTSNNTKIHVQYI